MQIGFIGYGEAAYEMSYGLHQEGLKEIVAYDPMWDDAQMKSLIEERANRASVKLLPTIQEVVQLANMLIVAVPADKAYGVSQTIAPYLNKGTLYIDVSASTPDIKKMIAQEIEQVESNFVDVAMMGSLPVHKHKVPILASGKGTDEFIRLMSTYNMNIEKASEVAGDASATKLIRSIYMKGVSVLLIEMLEAAHHFNVEDIVTESIFETMSNKDFKKIMNRLVTGTAIHSKRRAVELQGTLDILDAANINSAMTKAAKEKLDIITSYDLRDKFNGENPKSWQKVIEALKNV